MKRLLVFVALLISNSSMSAADSTDAPKGDPAPKRPVGKWVGTLPGGIATLDVGESKIALSFEGQAKGQDTKTTFSAVIYGVSRDSHIFGMFHSLDSRVGTEDRKIDHFAPFLFRFDVSGDTLTLSELNIEGVKWASEKAEKTVCKLTKQKETASKHQESPEKKR